MADFAKRRARMVERQIARRGVSDPAVLDAMRQVPRERFVPERLADLAYDDRALPIEAGQTISQPYIVALMLEAAELADTDHVLEIGAGSGYAAAVISRIAAHVITIERHAILADQARDRLAALGYDNVDVVTGDGTKFCPEAAPFDAIIVAAGGPEIPIAFRNQLKLGGRLVIPLGERDDQRLLKLTCIGKDDFRKQDLGSVAFVPLVSERD